MAMFCKEKSIEYFLRGVSFSSSFFFQCWYHLVQRLNEVFSLEGGGRANETVDGCAV